MQLFMVQSFLREQYILVSSHDVFAVLHPAQTLREHRIRDWLFVVQDIAIV